MVNKGGINLSEGELKKIIIIWAMMISEYIVEDRVCDVEHTTLLLRLIDYIHIRELEYNITV
jgi:hypothetical protein